MRQDHTVKAFALLGVALLVAGPWLPPWLSFISTVSLAHALVVAGVLMLLRTGLVSFGQGLYYCLGGYTVGIAGQQAGLRDAAVLLPLAVATSLTLAAIVGLLLARYREIFFAMFTMAFSMILYGLLSRSAALGSTDGFNVPPASYLGITPEAGTGQSWLFATATLATVVALVLVHRYLGSGMGFVGQAIRTNEIRVEYLGVSAYSVVYITYVLASALAGLGGGLAALAAGHVGPDMAYWTTSGEFVFVTLLGGTAHVAAAVLASLLFELVKSYALELAPYTWQMVLGFVLLAIVVFLPEGLWSLVTRVVRRKEPA